MKRGDIRGGVRLAAAKESAQNSELPWLARLWCTRAAEGGPYIQIVWVVFKLMVFPIEGKALEGC